MSLDVAYYLTRHRRSRILYAALAEHLNREGVGLRCVAEEAYTGALADVAVFYGLVGNLRKVIADHREGGRTAILFDLGYWGQHDGGRLEGYHRIAVNGYHGWSKLHGLNLPDDRLRRLGITVKEPRKDGNHILLCGQSAKAAWVYGMEPEEWERRTIEELRRHTDRPIWYMPKVSWDGKRPIEGTKYHDHTLAEGLRDAWAVVTHHSNSGLYAKAEGIPIFTEDGIAKPLSSGRLRHIENPRHHDPGTVRSLLGRAAYMQWKTAEIADGTFWRNITEMGIIPS